jgi:dTMP kinase
MEKNTYPGKFVVFEGIDGSGHSTQVDLLKNFLIEKGYNVVATKEPTLEFETGKEIKRVLDGEIKVSLKELQELFVKDRGEHLENIIIPSLKEGKIVISDRYFFSTLAYGASGGLDLEWLINLNNDYLYPDITFLLKVDPEICIDRIIKRGDKISIFEKKEKLEAIWEVYKILPKRFKDIHVIDGEGSIEKVFEDIKNIIIRQLAEKNYDEVQQKKCR